MGLCLYMPMDVAKSYHKIIHVLNKKYFFYMQMTHNGLSIHHPRIYRIQKSLPPTHQVFLFTKNTNKRGPYKRTQTVAHQCLLQLPPYTKRRSTRGRKKESLVYCGLSTAAAAVHKRLFFLPRISCTAVPQYMRHCSASDCRGGQNLACRSAAIGALLYHP